MDGTPPDRKFLKIELSLETEPNGHVAEVDLARSKSGVTCFSIILSP